MDRLVSLAVLLSVLAAAYAADTATWNVNSGTGTNVCVLASFNADIIVSYQAIMPATNTSYIRAANITVPQSASVNSDDSSCSAGITMERQRLSLQWGGTTYKYNLTFVFVRNAGVTTVSKVDFQYDLSDSSVFTEAAPTNNSLQTTSLVGNKFATIDGDQFLQCNTGIMGDLKTLDNFKGNVTLTGIRMQAFRNSTSTTFDGIAEVCDGDRNTTPMPTTMAPSTTPAPINVANYTMLDSDHHTCLIALFDLTIGVTYEQIQPDGSRKNVSTTIDGVNNGTVSPKSVCGVNETVLVIEGLIPLWELQLKFTNSSGRFYVEQVVLKFDLFNSTKINNATFTPLQVSTTTSMGKWSAGLGHSYRCGGRDTWKLNTTGLIGASEINLQVDRIQVQAFMSNATGPNFGTAEDCAADHPTSDIVPIAVGCALAALVVIVLIAYVIGRRRNRARGYESM